VFFDDLVNIFRLGAPFHTSGAPVTSSASQGRVLKGHWWDDPQNVRRGDGSLISPQYDDQLRTKTSQCVVRFLRRWGGGVKMTDLKDNKQKKASDFLAVPQLFRFGGEERNVSKLSPNHRSKSPPLVLATAQSVILSYNERDFLIV